MKAGADRDRRDTDGGQRQPRLDPAFEQIAREILAEDKATDEAEDRAATVTRVVTSCPSSCARAEGRREFFAQAKRSWRRERRRSRAGRGGASAEQPERAEPQFEFDEERIVARTQGREGWLREARRQLEQHRWEHPDPVPRSRAGAAAARGRAARGGARDRAPRRTRHMSSSGQRRREDRRASGRRTAEAVSATRGARPGR